MNSDIASTVAKELVRQQLAAENTEKQKVQFENEFQSYVMSIVAKGMPTGTQNKGNKNDSSHADKQSVSIHLILKRVGKNWPDPAVAVSVSGAKITTKPSRIPNKRWYQMYIWVP